MSLTSSNLCCCLPQPWQWLKGACCNNNSSSQPYLGKYDLQRVLALIGYLATHDQKNNVGVTIANRELPFPGSTEPNWAQVVKSHPEFFVLADEDGSQLRLWARFKQEGGRDPLMPDRIFQLQETAMKLHSAAVSLSAHEMERRNFWISSFFGLFGGVLAALVTCWLKGN